MSGRTGAAVASAAPTGRRKSLLRQFAPSLYVLPAAILVAAFSILPTVMGVWFGFTEYDGLGDAQFIGFDNFTRLFQDPEFFNAARVTVIFAVGTIPAVTMFSLILAEVLAKAFLNRFGKVVRTVLFVPVIASMVLAGTIWRMLLADEGFVDTVLAFFGIKAPYWLGDPVWALPAVMVISIWKSVGYYVVLLYAAVLDVPKDLYEAAELDGAGAARRFRHVTIPGVRTVTFLVLILQTIEAFQVFDVIYATTQGGPIGSTTTMTMLIYNAAFRHFEMGYASAMSLVMAIIIIGVSLIQNLFVNREGK